MNYSIKKGDAVKVISGKDKGKSGQVLAVLKDEHRVIVEGVNIISKHTKPRSAQQKGGIVKREGSIDISNVMLVCASCGKTTRVGHKTENADGKENKVRVCVKCGAVIAENKAKAAVKKAKKTVKKSDTKEAENTAPAKKNAPKKKTAATEKTNEVKTEVKTTVKKRTAASADKASDGGKE